MKLEQITNRQVTMLFSLHHLGSAFLLLPGSLATTAKQDAWISISFSLFFALFLLLLHILLSKKMQNRSLTSYILFLFGRPLGRFIIFIYIICYPLLISMTVLRDLGDFLGNAYLTVTPPEAFYFIFLVCVYYAIRSGLSTIGRLAELLFFIVVLLFAIGYIPLLFDFELANLQPIFDQGLKPVIAGSFTLLSFPYFENIFILQLKDRFKHPDRWIKVWLKSTVISGFMFFLVTLLSIGVLSEAITANLRYPSVFVVRTISIANFFERFEVLVAVFWYITIFFRISLLTYISLDGLRVSLHLHKPQNMIIPLLFLILFGATIIWKDVSSLIEILSFWPFYAMVFGIVFPIILVIGGYIRKEPRKSTSRSESI
ncbi:GerAB/ArcD/ProY family transporter [Alkalihalobacillus pseudalcaliphilus]|uniref:GerAB/ArcD/ProY family transporter n=1 Tax=Alkalihalobacillus pseudalcaliphilus TaxID=79884 RepID=UPI00064D8C15|nr:endospore germination permease [Alkalihalobacillus pseudalcaliphilus]KMK76222.1 hypothetical protein AB990_13480 [Alkalihalobacillus pseudalcaliphilus]